MLTVSGDLVFQEVQDLLEAYRKLNNPSSIEISLAEIGEIDLPGLQLLYAIRNDRNETGHALRFTGEQALERISRMAEFAGLPQLEQE
ncbi:MAG: STAS domain-containing protein [Alkalispirochaeta sp.]